MGKNKDFKNLAITPDQKALEALKIIASKLGEVAGGMKRLYSVTYKLALTLNGILDSYKENGK